MKLQESIERHFGNLGFQWQGSVPILSTNPKLLFNISGGVVFEDIIVRGITPERPRLVSIQTCLRTDGWKKIGVSGRHHLAFDMLGHFSLYESNERLVKDLMIESAWRFLTDCIGIHPNRLSATVHPRDKVSQGIWKRLGVKIVLKDENVTFTPIRNRCGVRTEIVWHQSVKRSVELWNLVFTQFQGDILFKNRMDKIAADSGASIDRLVTAIEGCNSDYENSLWKGIILSLTRSATIREHTAMCRLADLGKAASLLIYQGLRPGNKTAEYVLRKIIREAYVICRQVPLSFKEFGVISSEWWIPTESATNIVLPVILEEALRFEQSLERGRKEYIKLISHKQGLLNEQEIEYLASTFGYPRALIEFEENQRKGKVL